MTINNSNLWERLSITKAHKSIIHCSSVVTKQIKFGLKKRSVLFHAHKKAIFIVKRTKYQAKSFNKSIELHYLA